MERVNPEIDGFEDDMEAKVFELKKFPAEKPKTAPPRRLNWLILGIVAAIVVLALYLTLVRNRLASRTAVHLAEFLKREYSTKPSLVIAIISALMVFVIVTGLSLHALLSVLACLVIRNFWLSVSVLLVSSVIGDVCVFFIAKFGCRKWLFSKFSTNDFFVLLLEESKNSPYKTAFLARMLFIPAGIKNYILALIDNPARSYFLSGLVLHLVYILEASLVAQELSEIEQILNHNRSWSQKAIGEKISFVVVLCLILFTIVFAAILGIWATKKMAKRRKPEDTIMKDLDF